ncbi:MAG: hypothetical protein DRZ76_03240 [Candidatus Nealsonbacteria bacterium]|nr:MAG: hypothetical protein DRZ76_03240 [Candidatus Nealsonbacteria bacterium]
MVSAIQTGSARELITAAKMYAEMPALTAMLLSIVLEEQTALQTASNLLGVNAMIMIYAQVLILAMISECALELQLTAQTLTLAQ